jgi:hypothetical protein
MPTSPCGLQDVLAHLWWSHGAVEEFPKRVLVVDRLAHRACRHVPTVGRPPVGGGRVHDQRNRQAGLQGRRALEEAWQRLAEVERWPEWAPHITSVTVSPPGELGPTSSGALQITRLGRNTFRMSVWEPPVRWAWVGGLPGVGIYYDHRFESSGPGATRLEWLVELNGPWRRSFDLSSPGCTVAISTGRSPDCRSGSAADGRDRRQVFATVGRAGAGGRSRRGCRSP